MSGFFVILDEIGDLSPALQVKLLHVLETRAGQARGFSWIVAMTHHDLERMIEEGRFRHDFYFRLNVIGSTISPLREGGLSPFAGDGAGPLQPEI